MHCRLDASLFEDSKAYSADESLQMFVLRWTEICRDLQKKVYLSLEQISQPQPKISSILPT